MAATIRKCSTIRCRPGEDIPLTVEGFQTDPDRGCVAEWAIVGKSDPGGLVIVQPTADGQSARFNATDPGCYTVRVRCCCRGANAG